MDSPNTRLTVEAPTPAGVASDYYGNRGINLITDSVFTPLASLQTAAPSANAISTQIDRVFFNTSTQSDITSWMKGFFLPGKSSLYEFEVVSNGEAILMLSTDSTSAKKVFECIFMNFFKLKN